MNSVNLTGRAAKQLELRYTPNGKSVTNGTIAVQRKFKNAQGKYDADFFDFVCWGPAAEHMANYIEKGNMFGISGELQTRTWEKDDGSKQKITEVNVSSFDFPYDSKPKQESQQPSKQDTEDPFAKDGEPIDISDDSLPF